MANPLGKSSRKRRSKRYERFLPKTLPKIFFCGDPHGRFDYINDAVKAHRPDAIVILGDMQPSDSMEKLLPDAIKLTQIYWIPGNHDTDTELFYDRLWKGPIAKNNLHGRVMNVYGVRIAGLGGVFRGQIWMPEGMPNYRTAASFIRNTSKGNLWRNGLPRRHRSSIFPSVYDGLIRQKADVLVTHEACGCHKKGFDAIDRLAVGLRVKWFFHAHQHEDHNYGEYKGFYARAIGYRGIVDIEGNVIVESQLDPRDELALQQAGEEPAPEILDSVSFTSIRELRRYKPKKPRHYRGQRVEKLGD